MRSIDGDDRGKALRVRRGSKVSRRIAAAALACALLAGVALSFAGCSVNPVVVTAQGSLAGTSEGAGVVAFRGIPYAKPPVGALRFKPPRPAIPWSGIRDATRFGPVEPQPPDDYETASQCPQSEDCLTLNVWTPSVETGGRPVMVWIHGGGWMYGSSRDEWYDGAALAKRGDVVVVSINYRLGVFGFLYLGKVAGEQYAQSGNLGLLDQVAALNWVKQNIAAFGGDPGNVTIFGESAGSMSVSTLMTVPAAKGLFHRVIAESGALNTVRTTRYADKVTRRFMDELGATGIEDLTSYTTDQLLKAECALTSLNVETDTLFGPVVDGSVLTEPPLRAIEKGAARDIELMTGTNLDEIRYWSLYIPGLVALPIKVVLPLAPTLQAAMGDRVDSIVGSYRSRRIGVREGSISMAIATDVMFRIPQIRFAEAQSKQNPRTWMYLFKWPSESNYELRSCHAIEIPFVFGNLHAPLVDEILSPSPPVKLSEMMQDTWIAFAKTGNPANGSIPRWPAYDGKTRATMVLDVRPAVENDPYRADRLVWENIPFDGVNPPVGGNAK
jgi:para-nitrobenzyl esterase